MGNFQLPSGVCHGLLPASYDPKALHLAKYLNRSTVRRPTRFSTAAPAVPLDMSAAIQPGGACDFVMSGMFANGPDIRAPQLIRDGVGDCFWVAIARWLALSALSVGKELWTSYDDMLRAILKGYSENTGFDPNNAGATDQGTDPTWAWPYLQKTGLQCSDGSFAKIGAVVQVNPRDFEELLIAFNIGGGLVLGFDLPEDWEEADVWDDNPSPLVGGHEVVAYSDLVIYHQSDAIEINTWGNARLVTPAACARFCSQATVLISSEALGPGGLSIQGFDSERILADARATQQAPA